MHRAAVIALALLLSSAPARAAQYDDEPEAPPRPSPTVTVCAKGQVWDEQAAACVDPESGALDDDRLLDAARALADAGRYDDAIRAARAMRAAQGSPALTVQGYAHRKAGRIGEGLRLYDAALARDPDNHLARSYLGQHHVEQGDLVAARAQLLEIEARGGAQTWSYAALRTAIVDGAGGY